MITGPLLEGVAQRVAHDKEEGDIAYFYSLLHQLEHFTKLTTAAVVACVGDDQDRHRYSLQHALVRADSLGEWVEKLNDALTGPAAQCMAPGASAISRELLERVGEGDWRYEAVRLMTEVAEGMGIPQKIGAKAALRQLFAIGVGIRNRSRGHGAITGAQCARLCGGLATALDALARSEIFRAQWAFLRRNLSGKYRVSKLLGDGSDFASLAGRTDIQLPDGVYTYIGGPVAVELVLSNADVRDVLVPNGNFRGGTFEALSYATNDSVRADGSRWLVPPGPLPRSHTEGPPALEPLGDAFANLPVAPAGHIVRAALESEIRDELVCVDRHPIVTLTGPGGIGKTTLALTAIDAICKSPAPPFAVVLWLSARDVDLLESGPKAVRPHVVTKEDVAAVAVQLLQPAECVQPDFNETRYMESCLRGGAAGATLFVLDNFETLQNPVDVFHWLDTHIRPPNKVLITTRYRDFSGDFAITIRGMTEPEANSLIDQEARRLGIDHLVTSSYKEELVRESDGHPYVIKILLGQVEREGRLVKPGRIVANADQLLAALFERTYASLSPGAQRTFLLLSSWRVMVPAVAVEAVSLREGNERFDVRAALDEVRRFSLIEELPSSSEAERVVGVPLAAAAFGRRKLEASPYKIAVEEDRKLLMELGAGSRGESQRGVLPRIERLVRGVARRSIEQPGVLGTHLPMLEYIASQVPGVYRLLAELLLEVESSTRHVEQAKEYLRRFLEVAPEQQRATVWEQLANLCARSGDLMGEVHAISELALLPSASVEEVARAANRLNSKMRELKGERINDAWTPEVRALIGRVAAVMERHRAKLTATQCSRLAWLYLHIGLTDRARDFANLGVERDPSDVHCQRIAEKLAT